METITLNDGTVLNGSIMPNDDDRIIFIFFHNMTIPQGIELLRDSSKFEKLICFSYGNTHEYEGYTKIVSITSEFGNCNVVMEKSDSNA